MFRKLLVLAFGGMLMAATLAVTPGSLSAEERGEVKIAATALGVPGAPAYGVPGAPAYGVPGAPAYGVPGALAYGGAQGPAALGVPGAPAYGVPGAASLRRAGCPRLRCAGSARLRRAGCPRLRLLRIPDVGRARTRPPRLLRIPDVGRPGSARLRRADPPLSASQGTRCGACRERPLTACKDRPLTGWWPDPAGLGGSAVPVERAGRAGGSGAPQPVLCMVEPTNSAVIAEANVPAGQKVAVIANTETACRAINGTVANQAAGGARAVN